MTGEAQISRGLAAVQERIAAACQRAERSLGEVTLVCVSKTVPAEAIEIAHSCGARDFGENYGQHLRDKAKALASLEGLRWHFIGHLQKNKVKYVVGNAGLVHTIDSPALIEEIEHRAEARSLQQEVLAQLNISGEEAKSGVAEDELDDLLGCFAECSYTRCVGLMTMPPFFEDPDRARPIFRRLREIRDRAREEVRANVELRHLSMGMSGDFEAAIEEGATIVRVGTAVFGPREY